MENSTATTGHVLVKTVSLSQTWLPAVDIQLNHPIMVFSRRLTPAATCRMCVYAMPLRTLEKLIMSFLLDQYEMGSLHPYSYAAVGVFLGKSEHSIEAAVSSLRAMGLVSTYRAARTGHDIVFNLDRLINWASGLLGLTPASTVTQITPDTSVEPPRIVQETSADSEGSGSPSKSKKPRKRVSRVSVAPVSDPPDDSTSSVWIKPVPRIKETGLFDLDKLSRKPFELCSDEELSAKCDPFYGRELPPGCYRDHVTGVVKFDHLSGHPVPPEFQVDTEQYDGEFDNTEELEATLAAEGRKVEVVESSDDSFDFSSGAETADTDINPNVRMNPNI